MNIGPSLLATLKNKPLHFSILGYILNGITLSEMINITGLNAQELRRCIQDLYLILDMPELKSDIDRLHLIFKLTKKKRRFLI